MTEVGLRDGMTSWPKETSSAHLFISESFLPPHLSCLTRLAVNAGRPPSASERGRACTEEQMGNITELENLE